MSKDCPDCDGTGKKADTCDECESRGWVHDTSDGGTMTCPECDGGESAEDCDTCQDVGDTPEDYEDEDPDRE